MAEASRTTQTNLPVRLRDQTGSGSPYPHPLPSQTSNLLPGSAIRKASEASKRRQDASHVGRPRLPPVELGVRAISRKNNVRPSQTALEQQNDLGSKNQLEDPSKGIYTY